MRRQNPSVTNTPVQLARPGRAAPRARALGVAAVALVLQLPLAACSEPASIPEAGHIPTTVAAAPISTPSFASPDERIVEPPIDAGDSIAQFTYVDSAGVEWELRPTFYWQGEWEVFENGGTSRAYSAALEVTNLSDIEGDFERVSKDAMVLFGPVYRYDPAQPGLCSEPAASIMLTGPDRSEFTGNCMIQAGLNTAEFSRQNPRGMSAVAPGELVVIYIEDSVAFRDVASTAILAPDNLATEIAAVVPDAGWVSTCHESKFGHQIFYSQTPLSGCVDPDAK
ncbi:hypothetical protein [Cellulomonas sp. PS-H5]|uniref:hypothetical protein n=1 Tax=Cellulomonas sp. PS-H5 TaxID=2820400 RepID=UPI001C4E6D14|nr:hypothetical protein [Cellulomonas sp. PS-H5]MBW0252592.1 hypothetical protein [Cellulomonas sp. PS-H5]